MLKDVSSPENCQPCGALHMNLWRTFAQITTAAVELLPPKCVLYIHITFTNQTSCSMLYMMHVGEDEYSPTVVGVEVRTAPLAAEPWVRSYGVIDGGLEVMRAAWPRLEHVF